jgi:hypothetical protein
MAFDGVGFAHAIKGHIVISTKSYFICLALLRRYCQYTTMFDLFGAEY